MSARVVVCGSDRVHAQALASAIRGGIAVGGEGELLAALEAGAAVVVLDATSARDEAQRLASVLCAREVPPEVVVLVRGTESAFDGAPGAITLDVNRQLADLSAIVGRLSAL